MGKERTKERQISELKAYAVTEHRFLPDHGLDAWLLRHKRTGARIAVLPCSDTNRAFCIAFRTPPKDSKGAPHVTEHAVFGGSRDFPGCRSFSQLLEGSFNSYANALTMPDRTVFLFSTTNTEDYANLMHIYTDAVFHPLFLTDRRIFEQEAWRLEVLPDERGRILPDNGIQVNGIVLNEMTAEAGTADTVLNDASYGALFAGTCYVHDAGGRPELITDLTWEELKAFHQAYYHPSNCWIYLYGDLDMAERLTWLDKHCLSEYSPAAVDASPGTLKEAPSRQNAVLPYRFAAGADTAGASFLSLHYALPAGEDPLDLLGFSCLMEALCGDNEEAPLRKALLDTDIARDISVGFSRNQLYPLWTIQASGAEGSDRDRFFSLVREALQKAADEGIDGELLRGAIRSSAFDYRDTDSSASALGLEFGLQILAEWIYDEGRALSPLDRGVLYAELDRRVGTGYFEGLLRRYILDNPRFFLSALVPDKDLGPAIARRLMEKEERLTAALGPGERALLARRTRHFRSWQEAPARQHPAVLSVKDIPEKARPLCIVPARIRTAEGEVPVLCHPQTCGGIDTLRFSFDLAGLPPRLLPLLLLFDHLFGNLGTADHSSGEMDRLLAARPGELYHSLNVFQEAAPPLVTRHRFDLVLRLDHGDLREVLPYAAEFLTRSDFSDRKLMRRLLENMNDAYRRMETDPVEQAQTRALERVVSDPWMAALENDRLMAAVHDLTEHFGERFEGLRKDLTEIAGFAFARDRLLIDVTADEGLIPDILSALPGFAESLPLSGKPCPEAGETSVSPQPPLRCGIITSDGVGSVIAVGSYARSGFAWSGSYRVLEQVLEDEYLWPRIRQTGGAYGFSVTLRRNGIVLLQTDRDPDCFASLEILRGIPAFLRSYRADRGALGARIVTAAAELDSPMGARDRGIESYVCWLRGITDEMLQRERDDLLHTTEETIRSFAALFEAVLEDCSIVCVSDRERIERHADMFDTIREA